MPIVSGYRSLKAATANTGRIFGDCPALFSLNPKNTILRQGASRRFQTASPWFFRHSPLEQTSSALADITSGDLTHWHSQFEADMPKTKSKFQIKRELHFRIALIFQMLLASAVKLTKGPELLEYGFGAHYTVTAIKEPPR